MKKLFISFIFLLLLSNIVLSQQKSKYSLSIQATAGITGETGYKSYFGTSHRYLITRNLKSNFSISTGFGFNTRRSYSIPKYVAVNTYNQSAWNDYIGQGETYYTKAILLNEDKQIEIPFFINYETETVFKKLVLFGRLGTSLNFTNNRKRIPIRYMDFNKSDIFFLRTDEYKWVIPNQFKYRYYPGLFGSMITQIGIGYPFKKLNFRIGLHAQFSPIENIWKKDISVLFEISRKFSQKPVNRTKSIPKHTISFESFNRFSYSINYERLLQQKRKIHSVIQFGGNIIPSRYNDYETVPLSITELPIMLKFGFSHLIGLKRLKPELGPYIIYDFNEILTESSFALGINMGFRLITQKSNFFRCVFSPNFYNSNVNPLIGFSYGIGF